MLAKCGWIPHHCPLLDSSSYQGKYASSCSCRGGHLLQLGRKNPLYGLPWPLLLLPSDVAGYDDRFPNFEYYDLISLDASTQTINGFLCSLLVIIKPFSTLYFIPQLSVRQMRRGCEILIQRILVSLVHDGFVKMKFSAHNIVSGWPR